MAGEEVPTVKSAQRTVEILHVLGSAPGHLGLGELQKITGFPRSSLHALIRTLKEAKWIEADVTGTKYQIGPRALLAGTSYLDKDAAIPIAHQSIESLRDEVGHTVHFGRLDDASVIYLASLESTLTPRLVRRIGRQLPASATALGRALLADLTDDEVTALLPESLPTLTQHTIATRTELLAELQRVRERGWATEREQALEGVGCIAVAVHYRIPATDAISCSFPLAAVSSERAFAKLAEQVVACAEDLAQQLRRAGIR